MKRLLVADDDAGMRAALEARFQRRGWLVDVAVNGTEALQKFRAGLHSLVITDVRMPGRDGFELMREMQTLDAHSPSARTAVILLTAYGCVPDAVEAMLTILVGTIRWRFPAACSRFSRKVRICRPVSSRASARRPTHRGASASFRRRRGVCSRFSPKGTGCLRDRSRRPPPRSGGTPFSLRQPVSSGPFNRRAK